MSFESACHRIGFRPILFDAGSGTSLEKGETEEDTLYNIAAMEPAALVVRAGAKLNLKALAEKIQIPIFNAGWGSLGHPTQALLDLYTIWREGALRPGVKLLCVGDIRHSRVIASHLEVAKELGVELGFCGPADLLPSSSVPQFSDLNAALKWADIVMALRMQLERHDQSVPVSLQNYYENFGLSRERLTNLKTDGLIMHPGPVNQGVDLNIEVFKDSRCRILSQVTNGVYLREALLRKHLGVK